MRNGLNGAGLFIQAISGLTSNYANLMAGNTSGGLSLDDIKNFGDDVNKNSLDTTFVSYLATNFSQFDEDGDGMVTSKEMQEYTNAMAQSGLTIEQLTQLCAQNGGTNTLLETVLSNFNKVDKNHDGKVSNEEISLYGLDKDIDKMKDEYKRVDENSTASIYYSSSSSSDTEDEES